MKENYKITIEPPDKEGGDYVGHIEGIPSSRTRGKTQDAVYKVLVEKVKGLMLTDAKKHAETEIKKALKGFK